MRACCWSRRWVAFGPHQPETASVRYVVYTMLRKPRNPNIEAPIFPRILLLIRDPDRRGNASCCSGATQGSSTVQLLAEGGITMHTARNKRTTSGHPPAKVL